MVNRIHKKMIVILFGYNFVKQKYYALGVEIVPVAVTTVEATAAVVTDETVSVGAGLVVVGYGTTAGAAVTSGPSTAFAVWPFIEIICPPLESPAV